MASNDDFEKTQKELMDSVRRMMSQMSAQNPQPDDTRRQEEEKKEHEDRRKKREHLLNFNYKPKDIKKYLDRFVIRQDDAKKVLATAVCDHYNYVRQCESGQESKHYVKQNILMLGPTGVGKTYLIKCLADMIGVPFVKADATKFSETGYVGADVEDLIRDLAAKAEGDLELAQYGIVYIDEVDKIAAPSNLAGRDVSGGGVQRGLLKIMEDSDVPLRGGNDIQSQLQAMLEFQRNGKAQKPVINTRHILFIVSGAFSQLSPIIDKRLRTSQIGFASKTAGERDMSHLFRAARTEDFIEFGFEPEFIGRLPVRVVCDPLNETDLYRILDESEGSVLKQFRLSFEAYGITMNWEAEALRWIAATAVSEGTGARGLLTVCESILRHFKYELPSSRVRHITLNMKMIENGSAVLEHLLSEDLQALLKKILEEIRLFEEEFFHKNQIRIAFSEKARALAAAKILKEERETVPFLEALLRDYPYGLSLIRKKKEIDCFELPEAVIQDSKKALDAMIKEHYEA